MYKYILDMEYKYLYGGKKKFNFAFIKEALIFPCIFVKFVFVLEYTDSEILNYINVNI